MGHINSFSLAEILMAQMLKSMDHTMLVLDAFPVGQLVDNKLPNSMFVTFGWRMREERNSRQCSGGAISP